MSHIQRRVRGGVVRYVARHTGPDGREHSKTFDRLGKPNQPGTAAHWLSEQEAAIRDHSWLDPTAAATTLGGWADRWLAHRTGIAASTLALYRTIVRVDVHDAGIGAIPLRDLTPARLGRWMTEMTGTRDWAPKPLAPSTATTRRNVLATILDAAIDEGLLTRNPLSTVKAPLRSVEATPLDPHDLPTADDIWRLYDNCIPSLRELVIVAAGTGLRRGEALGLRLRNVRDGEVHVVEQLLMAESTRTFGPPKTRRARRRIPIGEQVDDALTRHMKAFPAGDDEVIFRHRNGLPWRRSTFIREWDITRTKAGMPGLRFHMLRNYYASVLIAGGASVREVMERMGHASAEETLGTYARLWPASADSTRKIADAALRRDRDGTGTPV